MLQVIVGADVVAFGGGWGGREGEGRGSEEGEGCGGGAGAEGEGDGTHQGPLGPGSGLSFCSNPSPPPLRSLPWSRL